MADVWCDIRAMDTGNTHSNPHSNSHDRNWLTYPQSFAPDTGMTACTC